MESRSVLPKISAVITALVMLMVMLCSCMTDNALRENEELPEIVVGVDYYGPFVYKDSDGEFAGIDIELAKEVFRHIGYKPKFVHIVWGEKAAYLERGEIDCIWCCFTVTGREDDYAWSLPYMNSRQVVAVKKDSGIDDIKGLTNKKVAVQSTTKSDEILSGKAGVKNFEIPKLKELNCFPNIKYIFSALNEGYVDAIAGHELVLLDYMKSSSADLNILSEPLLEVQVGIAFLQGTHADTIQLINKTLLLLKSTGYLSKLFESHGLDPDIYVVDYEQK